MGSSVGGASCRAGDENDRKGATAESSTYQDQASFTCGPIAIPALPAGSVAFRGQAEYDGHLDPTAHHGTAHHARDKHRSPRDSEYLRVHIRSPGTGHHPRSYAPKAKCQPGKYAVLGTETQPRV